MIQAPRLFFVAAVVASLVCSAASFVVGSSSGLVRSASGVGRGTTSAAADHDPVQKRGVAVQPLRASADDGEGGGFVNPYTAFRKWQMELVRRYPKRCGRQFVRVRRVYLSCSLPSAFHLKPVVGSSSGTWNVDNTRDQFRESGTSIDFVGREDVRPATLPGCRF